MSCGTPKEISDSLASSLPFNNKVSQDALFGYEDKVNALTDSIAAIKAPDVATDILPTVTTTIPGGLGAFDVFARSMLNHLEDARSANLISHNDIANIYTTAMPQLMQLAMDYALRSQLASIEAQTAAIRQMQAQTEALMLPIRYAQAVNELNVSEIQAKESLMRLRTACIEQSLAEAQVEDVKTGTQEKLQNIELLKAKVKVAETEIKTAENALKASYAQYRDTLEDGSPIGGVLGAQIAVNKAQALAIEKNAYQNFISQLKDGWNTKKTSDIATLSPDLFTAYGVNAAFKDYANRYLGIDGALFDLPTNYRDYLSSEEMSGESATPSTSDAKATG